MASHGWARRCDLRFVGARCLTKGLRNTGSGFSLPELVLVAAIMAVVAALAVPRYGRAFARYQLDLAARRVAADLEMAQSCAKAASSPCTVLFTPVTNEYRLMNVASFDGASGNYSVCLAAEPYRVTLALANFGGDPEVTFSGWGLPDDGGEVVLAIGSQQRKIIMDSETGRISIE